MAINGKKGWPREEASAGSGEVCAAASADDEPGFPSWFGAGAEAGGPSAFWASAAEASCQMHPSFLVTR